MKNNPDTQCELCSRVVLVTRHHLVPRSHDGAQGAVALLCSNCRWQPHAFYANGDFAGQLNSIDSLKQDEWVQAYPRRIQKANRIPKPRTRRDTVR